MVAVAVGVGDGAAHTGGYKCWSGLTAELWPLPKSLRIERSRHHLESSLHQLAVVSSRSPLGELAYDDTSNVIAILKQADLIVLRRVVGIKARCAIRC